jgi:hypothetical protein
VAQVVDCEKPTNPMIFMAGETTNVLQADGIPGRKSGPTHGRTAIITNGNIFLAAGIGN